MVVLDKLVDSVSINPVSLYNQAVEVICQEAAMTLNCKVATYYLNYTGK